jgi:hypothetical protein
MVMDPETRNENLTEYYPSNQQDTVKFGALLDEIAGDLAMVSFIPGADKCVIVTNPAEVFGAGGKAEGKKGEKAEKGKKDEEHLVRWIQRDLPQTGHHVILLAFEDESSQREVDQRCPLYQAVQKVGLTRGFSDTKAFFRIEDAIVSRRPAECIQAVRDLWKPGKGDMAAYGAVVRCLRYLLQANIARERKLGQDAIALATFFPGDARLNLFTAHPNVRRKYEARGLYRTADLLKAYAGTLDVYRALRPRQGDIYVPDAQGLLEQTLLELMTSPSPRQR